MWLKSYQPKIFQRAIFTKYSELNSYRQRSLYIYACVVSVHVNPVNFRSFLVAGGGCSNYPVYLYGRNGTFTSPNFPGSYPNNARCEWRILVPYGYRVRLSFTAFNTESCCDHVEIRSNSTGLHRRFSGSTLPPYLLGGQEIRVNFRSDGSVTRSGFRAVFTAVYGPPYVTTRPPIHTTTRPGKNFDHKRNNKNLLVLHGQQELVHVKLQTKVTLLISR